MMQQHESWAGNLMGWAFWGWVVKISGGALDWMVAYGIPMVSGLLLCWYTIERANAERARRRAYDRMSLDQVPVRRSLLGALLRRRGEPGGISPTDPGTFDSDPQAHPDGK